MLILLNAGHQNKLATTNTGLEQYIYCTEVLNYRCNSFVVDLRHKLTVRSMNEIPVSVQSCELNNRT